MLIVEDIFGRFITKEQRILFVIRVVWLAMILFFMFFFTFLIASQHVGFHVEVFFELKTLIQALSLSLPSRV